jgi:hypothetical protein
MAHVARDVTAVAVAILALAGLFGVGMALSDRLASPVSQASRPPAAAGTRPAVADVPARPRQERAVEAAGSPVVAPRGEVPQDALSRQDVVSPQKTLSPQDAQSPLVAAGPLSGFSGNRGPVHPPAIRGSLAVASRDGAIDRGMRGAPANAINRRRVPRERGFDLAFEIQHGESPFIDPSAPSLAVDTPPLAAATDSFDAVLEATAAGDRVRGDEVRAEHVVAAMTGAVPAVGPAPVVTLHGVQSLRRAPTSILVDVAVTAPTIGGRGAAPLEATVIFDRSAAGGQSAVWWSTCRSLELIAALLRPADRVTVIVAAGEPACVIDRGDAAALRARWRSLAAMPDATDVDLDAAFRFARGKDGGRRARESCVVVSSRDSLDRATGEIADALAAWQQELSAGRDLANGLPVAFMLVGGSSGEGSAPGAGSRGGEVSRESVAIRRGLVEALFGSPAIAVRECRLTVTMNPAAVASYRLVGHRHSAIESVAPGDVAPAELLAGETVHAVYELVLKPVAGSNPGPSWIVRATAAGRSPVASPGDVVHQRAELGPGAVEPVGSLPSPRGCEIILSQELGEALAGSIHAAADRRAPRAVSELLRAWRGRGDITPFGLDVSACLELSRSGARANAATFDGP